MRKVLLGMALLSGGALLAGPASAEVGCACATINAAPVCVASIGQCATGMHGFCVAPCDYKAPKMAKRVRHKAKKAMKKM